MEHALGQTKGQWLQLDWDEGAALCGVLLLATGPRTRPSMSKPAAMGTGCRSATPAPPKKVPLHAVIGFEPVSTKSLRFVFEGGAAYYEVEVVCQPNPLWPGHGRIYEDSDRGRRGFAGHLMGTVSAGRRRGGGVYRGGNRCR